MFPLSYSVVCFLFILFLAKVLTQALVQIRALQDWCVANEGVICRFRKCQEIENKERDQYKEAIHTLNEELMVTTAPWRSSGPPSLSLMLAVSTTAMDLMTV